MDREKRRKTISTALLYFKVLLATEPYQKFCKAKNDDDESLISELLSQYPHINEIWNFWGDLYCFDRSLHFMDYFKAWMRENPEKLYPIYAKKIKIIQSGQTIKAEHGVIYITISELNSLSTAKQMYKSVLPEILKSIRREVGSYFSGLGNDQGMTLKKSEQYERCIDVLYWRKYQGLSPYQAIVKAYRSKRSAWTDIKYKVNKCHKVSHKEKLRSLNLDDLHSIVRTLDRYRQQGEMISESLLSSDFSAPSLFKF